MIATLALRSLANRRGTALLTMSTIAVSVALLLCVQMLREAAHRSFTSTLSGVDLIVAARTSPLSVILDTVFHVDDAQTNVSWESYEKIAHHPDVAWTIPLSLGDSHRGFRVLGTSTAYFDHYTFADGRALRFAAGAPFQALYDAVLGSEVARSLHYHVGDAIILSHGLGEVSFRVHRDKPFRIAGILAPTGTPVDRTIAVSVEAISAIHLDWQPSRSSAVSGATPLRSSDLTPESITAFMVGMRSRVMVFTMQRAINSYRVEPLVAVIPGIALDQLWSLMSTAEAALSAVGACVVLAGLLGMLATILTSLNERRREMAILRSLGAGAREIFALMLLEAVTLVMSGLIAGLALAYGTLLVLRPAFATRWGLVLPFEAPGAESAAIVLAVIVSATLIGCIPAWRAYRVSLADGLQIRL
jgi:putative ABC transport system permease protein